MLEENKSDYEFRTRKARTAAAASDAMSFSIASMAATGGQGDKARKPNEGARFVAVQRI